MTYAPMNRRFNEVTNCDGYEGRVARDWSAIDARNSQVARDLQIERTRAELRREQLQRVSDANRLRIVGEELGEALEGLQAVMRVAP